MVLASFANLTGDAIFDGTLDWALRDELEGSPYVNVLSAQDASKALTTIGDTQSKRLSVVISRQICNRVGGKAVVAGIISKQGSDYIVDLSASSCDRGGNTLTATRRTALEQKDVLSALSRALTTLRLRLGEPATSVQRFGVPAEDATSSLEALKDYSAALAESEKNGGPPTIPLLERVINLDPNFPLAYAALANVYHNLQEPALAQQSASRAFQLRSRATEREKLRISAAYFLATGQLDAEIQNYKKWQAEYPHDFLPYNDLGNDYAAMGQLHGALEEYKKGLQLEPTLIGYVNVGGMYISLNRFEEAKATFNEALSSNFDGRYLRMNLYWLAFLTGDPVQMTRQLVWASSRPEANDALLSEQSDTEAYDGRMETAREFSQRAVAAAISSGSKETAALWRVNEALREAEVGEFAIARSEVSSALALSADRDVTLIAAFTLARSDATRSATTLVKKLEKTYPTDSLMRLYWLPAIKATLALDDGDFIRAIALLRPVESHESGSAGTFISYLYPAFLRGQAYLDDGKGGAAAGEFRKLVLGKGIVQNFLTGALTHLELGRSYACVGEVSEAQAEYRTFFDIWNHADTDVPILRQARAEYSQLSRPTRTRCRHTAS